MYALKRSGGAVVFFRRVLIAAITALAFWTAIIMMFEEKFIFFPTRYPDGPYGQLLTSIGGRDEFFMTDDGLRLHAVYVPVNSSRGTVLLSHGNAGNIAHRAEFIRLLRHAGLSVFAYDYRGYGRSEGSPSEEGIYRDARGAYDHLRTLNVDSNRIIFWGTSLGGAVAVDLATHRQAAGVVLESTFSNARDVAAAVYPFLPVRWVIQSAFDSESKIRSLKIPTFHVHGERDDIIPLRLGQKLFAASSGHKEFYIVLNAGHNDTFWVGGSDYVDRIRSFAESVLPPIQASNP